MHINQCTVTVTVTDTDTITVKFIITVTIIDIDFYSTTTCTHVTLRNDSIAVLMVVALLKVSAASGKVDTAQQDQQAERGNSPRDVTPKSTVPHRPRGVQRSSRGVANRVQGTEYEA
jgi:hypothetical protein